MNLVVLAIAHNYKIVQLSNFLNLYIKFMGIAIGFSDVIGKEY